ncbi:MAG TPA: hypothetical protein VLL97_14625 [Acidobacteriota bacterium]|nr:hypothetical protein [Acidobacteriota bacterium]
MKTTASSRPTTGQKAEPLQEKPALSGEITAWKHVEGDLWIPCRIRGSCRGEALG